MAFTGKILKEYILGKMTMGVLLRKMIGKNGVVAL